MLPPGKFRGPSALSATSISYGITSRVPGDCARLTLLANRRLPPLAVGLSTSPITGQSRRHVKWELSKRHQLRCAKDRLCSIAVATIPKLSLTRFVAVELGFGIGTGRTPMSPRGTVDLHKIPKLCLEGERSWNAVWAVNRQVNCQLWGLTTRR